MASARRSFRSCTAMQEPSLEGKLFESKIQQKRAFKKQLHDTDMQAHCVEA